MEAFYERDYQTMIFINYDFVSHCGSPLEAMMTECQLVLLPNVEDQIINARLMGGCLAN